MTAYNYYKDHLGIENEELLQELVCCSRHGVGKKGEILIRQGQICDTIFLLETGMARGFMVDEQGDEITDCIVRAEWEIAVTGLVRQELNQEAFDSVELVEDSSYFAIRIADMLELKDKYLEISQLYLTILERSWQNQAETKRARYRLEVKERVEWFCDKYVGVENRMKKQDIASFLNMEPQTFSRCRKLIREG